MADDESLRGVIDILHDYEKATGSRINKEKTRYTYIGKWEERKDKMCDFTKAPRTY